MTDLFLEMCARDFCEHRRYDFLGLAGEGAFKKTFKIDIGPDDPRALKIYKPKGVGPRLLREVQAIQACNHPHIVKLDEFCAWQFDGQQYIVSVEEYVSGGSLGSWIERSFVEPIYAKTIGEQIISAVGHIMMLGLVHRDVKPDNIMVRETLNNVVLVDFGLVRRLDAESLTHTYLPQGPGTPLYASPEQLTNQKDLIDWRSDQFSIAVTIALSLGGFHPYADDAGTSAYEIVERVAARNGPSDNFTKWALRMGFPVLSDMSAPWPVQRFRNPIHLLDTWTKQ
jgi:serine/threonine protein kinase